MDMLDSWNTMEAIHVGVIIAAFLLNICRVQKAIEICKECLLLLETTDFFIFPENKTLENPYEFVRSTYIKIYSTMLKGYELLNDQQGEGEVAFELADQYRQQCKYSDALKMYEKALSSMKETGKRRKEGKCYICLGEVCQTIGKYHVAEQHHMKALKIMQQIKDRKGEADCYGNLGTVFSCLDEFDKAEEYQNKALVISKEIGDKHGEAASYSELGVLFRHRNEYGKAKKVLDKGLEITKEIGDMHGEEDCHLQLGIVLLALHKYDKAEEYFAKARTIAQEICNIKGEASACLHLGTVYHSIGNYSKAEEYFKKSLKICEEIGNRPGEAVCHSNLGGVFYCLEVFGENDNGKFAEAIECYEKALKIAKEIGSKKGEAVAYEGLGKVFECVGAHDQATEYFEKSLIIKQKIGGRKGIATCCASYGLSLFSLGNYAKAKEYLGKALAISKEIGDLETQRQSHLYLALSDLQSSNVAQHLEALADLSASFAKCEEMRSLLRDNDQDKISLSDKHGISYQSFSAMLCEIGAHAHALYVAELGRARALSDLMLTHYHGKQISSDPQSWASMEGIMENERNCSCLYISYLGPLMYLWVLKAKKTIKFCSINVNGCFSGKRSETNVHEIFSEEISRTIYPQDLCEDRSLLTDDFRPTEEEKEGDQTPVPTLSECYKMIFAPVIDFLKDEPEIIIIPDRLLYKVPFAALKNETEMYLSETFRIRIIPSLTTLKLIQDSPTDYHSQTGALIVGDPEVGEVLHKGHVKRISPLPCARRETEMIGQLLGVQPLIGKQATKQAVLQSIHSVSLIHFAAHGDAERGEIALAPLQPINAIPQEEEYLLTMTDISQVQLRAKLVVLSCCHSARGQIKTEGVVGIARAFLGSGARAVLVALWAIPDIATELLMSRFYEHLVHGESASESLHQAMKWMRSNRYSDVRDWAPFMLMGDNVTFDFGN